MARCSIDTLPLPRHPQHHELVTRGAELIAEPTKTMAGTFTGNGDGVGKPGTGDQRD